jgi:hypothetical protein
VNIYIRSGSSWKKAFSVYATEPIFLSTEPYTDKFMALVLGVHPGDLGCLGSDWKRTKCDYVIKWDGSRFVHKPL